MPDSEIAEILGISETQVLHKRYAERIKTYVEPVIPKRQDAMPNRFEFEDDEPFTPQRGRKPREWTEEELALLGRMTDADLAKALGLSTQTVSNKRKSLEIEPLGRRSDYEEVEYEEAEEEEDNEPYEEEEPEEPYEPGELRKPSGFVDLVGIEEELANKARIIAVQRGIPLNVYLSSMLRPGINQDYDKALAKLAQEYEPKTSR